MDQSTKTEKNANKGADLSRAFSSFSTDDIGKAKEFYGETLGIKVSEETEGLGLEFDSGPSLFIYPKKDHDPATFTVLNFYVKDIREAVDDLKAKGVGFESYDGDIETDENNIFWGAKDGHGPNIAWFMDPARNILSLIEG